MNCHQWCECPKCTTFYDSCHREIKNPHSGTYSETSESRIKELEQRLKDAEEVIAMVEDNRKMPHQHSDLQTRLYCLAERAREYQAKYKAEG